VAAVLGKDTLEVSTTDVAQWSIVSAGVWWAVLTTLPLLWLRNRPPIAGPARGSVLVAGFRQLWDTLRGLRAYPLILLFLAAFLIYNDGDRTVIALAGGIRHQRACSGRPTWTFACATSRSCGDSCVSCLARPV
jgi:UMF1 family MFS transporter